MRAFLPTLLAATAAACSNDPPEHQRNQGWDYKPAHGAYVATVEYHWGREKEPVFYGMCNHHADYMLTGGDYPLNTKKFTLVVDEHAWMLPAFQGVEGTGLPVDQPEQSLAIAQAKRRIVFQVGAWRRELRPSPALAQFAHDCPG